MTHNELENCSEFTYHAHITTIAKTKIVCEYLRRSIKVWLVIIIILIFNFLDNGW